VNWTGLLPGAMTICLAIGGVVAMTYGVGAGVGIILGGLVIVIVSWVFLTDPASELTSDNGILGIGKSLGFMLSQGVANNGPVSGGSTQTQLDTLSSWLCDVLVRNMIQLVNFGQVIDTLPGCAGLWNSALLSGERAAPAHAMRSCAPSALAHAQQL